MRIAEIPTSVDTENMVSFSKLLDLVKFCQDFL